MGWEDTVIKGRVKQDLTIHWTNTITGHLLGWQPTLEPNAQDIFDAWVEEIRQEQAQIAFKAGVKEVVDWVRAQPYSADVLGWESAQAKLKEWGLG